MSVFLYLYYILRAKILLVLLVSSYAFLLGSLRPSINFILGEVIQIMLPDDKLV